MVVLPVVAYAAQMFAHLGSPRLDGDYAVLEAWTRSALDLDALVGPYSRYRWNHPGPAAFYLWGPLFAATGQSASGLAVTTLAMNLSAMVGIAAVMWRSGGERSLIAASGALVWFVAAAGPTWFDDPWNPVIVVLPTALALAAAAAVVSGRPIQIVTVAAAASLAVQSHIGTVTPLAPALFVTVVFGLRGVLVDRSRWLGPVLAALGVAAVMWAPPIYQQLTTSPGNLGLITNDLGEDRGSHSVAEVIDASIAQFTLSDRDLMQRSLGRSTSDVGSGPLRVTALAAVVGTVLVLGFGSLRRVVNGRVGPWWRVDVPLSVALSLVGVLSCGSAVIGFIQVKGPLSGYLTLTALSVGLVLFMALAMLLMDQADRALRLGPEGPSRPSSPPSSETRVRPWARSLSTMALGVPALVSAGITVAVVWNMPSTLHANRASVATDAELEALTAQLPARDQPVSVTIVDLEAWPTAALILNQLEREGWTVTTTDDFLFMFGDQRRRTGCETVRVEVRTVGGSRSPAPTSVAVGRVGAAEVVVTALPDLPGC